MTPTSQRGDDRGFILVQGRPVPCAARVVRDPSMSFSSLGRRTQTDLVVCHWTGGEGGAEQVHRVLKGKGYSVHFLIDADGVITQYCDADRLCSHASGLNARAVGIEIANRADGEANRVPKRPLLREKIRGRDVVYTSFLPAQVHACMALCASLCEAYGLPLDVPRDEHGDVLAREWLPRERDAYRGVCGHLHWSPKGKTDPGLALLRAIAAFPARLAQGIGGPAE